MIMLKSVRLGEKSEIDKRITRLPSDILANGESVFKSDYDDTIVYAKSVQKRCDYISARDVPPIAIQVSMICESIKARTGRSRV
jgi:hypothetical protein